MLNTPAMLGAIGTALGLVRAVPQLVMLLRRREAFGVSVDTAGTSAIVGFGWVAYGLLTRQYYVSLATGASGVVFAMIAIAALRFGRQWREFRVTPLWFVVLACTGILAGAQGLGVVLPLSVLAANLPQLRVAYREADLTDLSLGTWLLSMADGLIWGTYAAMRHDPSIMAYGGLQVATSGLILAFKLARAAPRHP